MKREHFGLMPDGREVELITLEGGVARCRIITYGAAIVSLEVPDKGGRLVDVVLGCDTLDDYFAQKAYLGAVCGRYCNRIGGSGFSLDGVEYTLTANEGVNQLHGGVRGFDKCVWDVEEIVGGARFTLVSPHLDEGYPGELTATVDYILDGATLSLTYRAESDRDTVCNLTNHAYFNLDGHDAGSILEHELTLFADFYTPVADGQCIPTGEIASVAGTPMDFRSATLVGERINADFEQLVFGSGYDENWVVRGEAGDLRPAARVFSAQSGVAMYVETDLPGLQFYAGNHVGGVVGKGGVVYADRGGLCLESQFFPDSPNKADFPAPVLRAGETIISRTIFRFCSE